MVRLKEFVLGGADSRQEIHASLSLEDIQARHQRMLRINRGADMGVCGELPDQGVIDVEAEIPAHPRQSFSEGLAEDLNVHLGGQKSSFGAVEGLQGVQDHESAAATGGPVCAPVRSSDETARQVQAGASSCFVGASGGLSRPVDASELSPSVQGDVSELEPEPGASSSLAKEMNSGASVHLKGEQ